MLDCRTRYSIGETSSRVSSKHCRMISMDFINTVADSSKSSRIFLTKEMRLAMSMVSVRKLLLKRKKKCFRNRSISRNSKSYLLGSRCRKE